MERQAKRLAEYCQDRLQDALRAVGYHTADEYEVVHVRDDVIPNYPPEEVDRFIRTSREINANLQYLDKGMGPPEASLHVLEEGLAIQFHFRDHRVVFMTMERDIGRNFTRFIRDCQDHMR